MDQNYQHQDNQGTLYIVCTPIGNLDDISIRALNTLKEVDLIAAEDTRHTQKLLNNFDIKKPLLSYFEHNQQQRTTEILDLLAQGKNIALVSDAGMPGISDPGSILIKAVIQGQYKLTAIPGPSAFSMALVLSGLDSKKFSFEGFLPKPPKRIKHLKSLATEHRTMLFYESPHRLLGTLKDLTKVFGENQQAAVARELTKFYEEIKRGSLKDLINYFQENSARGEITIVLEGATEQEAELIEPEILKKELADLRKNGLKHKAAAKKLAAKYNLATNYIYELGLEN